MLAKTVKIKDGEDFRIINELDFQHGQHGAKLHRKPYH